MSEITITLHNPVNGKSESMPVADSLTIKEVLDLGAALLGMDNSNDQLVVTKYGKPLNVNKTLADESVSSGDLLALLTTRPNNNTTTTTTNNNNSGRATGAGGLDFSNLFGSGGGDNNVSSTNSGAGLDFSSLVGGGTANANAAARSSNPTPFYYAGMSFEEAAESNPHPKAIVLLIQTHSHLFKEFNYHMPLLAKKLQNQPYEKAVDIWREDMVKNSLRGATDRSQLFHKDKDFKQRLSQNPNDSKAKEYFEQKDRQKLVNEQYRDAMQEYPESMGRVLMLYIEAKINNKPLQAFVDSGAQTTIMSKKCAERCGIFNLLDTRFHGIAVGVGTGKILGRIHIAQLQIGNYYFPVTVTVMDNAALPVAGDSSRRMNDDDNSPPSPQDMDFLLGLDMLKRFNCSIDLLEGKLKFRLGSDILETPFLHEKDLDSSKGGTKGFDAKKANQELIEAQRKYEDKKDDNEGDNNMQE